MSALKAFFIAVMTVSVMAGAVTLLAPEGKEGGLKKQIGFAVSLALFCALLSPLLRLLGGGELTFSLPIPEVTAPDGQEAEAAVIALASDTVCRELEAELTRRYGITEASVSLTLDASDPTAIQILSASLDGEGALAEAAAYLRDLLGCPVDFPGS